MPKSIYLGRPHAFETISRSTRRRHIVVIQDDLTFRCTCEWGQRNTPMNAEEISKRASVGKKPCWHIRTAAADLKNAKSVGGL